MSEVEVALFWLEVGISVLPSLSSRAKFGNAERSRETLCLDFEVAPSLTASFAVRVGVSQPVTSAVLLHIPTPPVIPTLSEVEWRGICCSPKQIATLLQLTHSRRKPASYSLFIEPEQSQQRQITNAH